jgi:tetratricopeptide (TPR) repeat protein
LRCNKRVPLREGGVPIICARDLGRTLPRGLLLTTLAASALVSTALVRAQPVRADSATCVEGDALRSAGLLNDAEAAYRQVLTSPMPDPCAARGLGDLRTERDRRATLLSRSLRSAGLDDKTVNSLATLVRDGREDEIAAKFATEISSGDGFAIARALKDAGYLQAAGDVLADSIAADPAAPVPEDLQGLSDAGLHLAAAEALSRAGLDSASQSELELALKEDPTLHVPDELAAPTRRESWWNSFLGTVGPWLVTIAEILIAILAAVVLVLLGARLIRRFRVRMVVEIFTGGPDDKKSGTAAVAMVRENYGRLRNQNGGRSLDLVTSSGEVSIDLPEEVSGAYPQAGVIWALARLIDRLFPSRTRLVSGYLRPRDPVRGAGMTITYGRRYGKLFGEITVWEAEYGRLARAGDKDPVQPAYDRLGVPAAAWIMYQAGTRFSIRRRRTAKFELLGTKEWRSYAHFAVGADDHARGDWASARRRYLEALRCDPNNRGARFDLAVIELGLGDAGRESALKRLEGLRKELENPDERPQDPVWYRVRYTQAVLRITVEPRAGAGTKRKAPEAREAAIDLCANLVSVLDALEGRRRRNRSDQASADFLRAVQPMSLILLASALLEDGHPASIAGPHLQRTTLVAALRHAEADRSADHGFDRTITHDAICDYVVRELQPFDAGAHYNLACYYTRVTNLPEAGASLRAAVELGGPSVGEQALHDPVLEPYLNQDKNRDSLEALIDGLKDPDRAKDAQAPRESLLGKIIGEIT